MAGTSVSVKAEGFSRLDLLIGRLANPDFTPLLDSIGALVVSQTETRITKTKAAPDGTKWPELNEAYSKRKKKGGGILELEGDLRDSLVHLVTGKTAVVIGTNLVYAATHQFGDPRRNIQQREFLGISPENEEAISGLIEAWIEQQTAAA
jgi:phage virion morphogenesis protein